MYDLKYFKDKFGAIPEEAWCVATITNSDGAHCVLGHCGTTATVRGYKLTEEGLGLVQILGVEDYNKVWEINDLWTELGTTPKQRILTALDLISIFQN